MSLANWLSVKFNIRIAIVPSMAYCWLFKLTPYFSKTDLTVRLSIESRFI